MIKPRDLSLRIPKTRIEKFEWSDYQLRKAIRFVFDSKELSLDLCMEVEVRKILKDLDSCQGCLEIVMDFLGKQSFLCFVCHRSVYHLVCIKRIQAWTFYGIFYS